MTESLQKKLAAYAGMTAAYLASVQSADAQVIYTDVNPDAVIHHDSCFLDLNNDGVTDFVFYADAHSFINTYGGNLLSASGVYKTYLIISKNDNSVLIDTLPKPLPVGEIISANSPFAKESVLYKKMHTFLAHSTLPYGSITAFSSNQTSGNWQAPIENYVGLKFKIDSETHYGWARIKINDGKLTLFDYAYNAKSNEQVLAGQWDVRYKPFSPPDIDSVLISVKDGELILFDKKLEYYQGDLRIYDAMERLLFTKSKINSEEIISIADFLPGAYFVQLIQANNLYDPDNKRKTAVQKFIVSH